MKKGYKIKGCVFVCVLIIRTVLQSPTKNRETSKAFGLLNDHKLLLVSYEWNAPTKIKLIRELTFLLTANGPLPR